MHARAYLPRNSALARSASWERHASGLVLGNGRVQPLKLVPGADASLRRHYLRRKATDAPNSTAPMARHHRSNRGTYSRELEYVRL